MVTKIAGWMCAVAAVGLVVAIKSGAVAVDRTMPFIWVLLFAALAVAVAEYLIRKAGTKNG